MIKFPMLMYKCPGNHQRPGGTYDYLGVKEVEGYKAALDNGWFPTLDEAIEGKLKHGKTEFVPKEVEPKEPEPIDEVPPPTRKELEQKAKELGIGFNKNTKDETLLEKIDAALDEE